jgi:proteasome activator subunit 4
MDPAGRDIVVVDANNRLAEPPSALHSTEKQDAGATTPNAHWSEANGTVDGSAKRRSLQQQQQEQEQEQRRPQHRERTYPYSRYLPYQVEGDQSRQKNLDDILKRLYIAIQARDFVPGAVHWTRELRNWLFLKFDLSREKRATLAKLFYNLSLTPGIEHAVSERFASTFMTLTK